MEKMIGFFGLGVMGKPMAKNLIRAGYKLVVYDLDCQKVDEVVSFGAQRGESIIDVAQKSDIIITMLPDSPQVEEVVCGKGGVLEGASPNSILIDMSSIAPLVSEKIAKACSEKNIKMLDAPVSGGEPKAIDGTLSIMVGGDKEVFDECYPILSKMGSSVTLCGKIGSGNITKLANQIIVAVNIAAVCEALVMGKKAGVEPEVIYNAIRNGLAGSTVLDSKAPMMLDRHFDPGFRIALHIKDLSNVINTGYSVGSPLPLTTTVMEMMQWLRANGMASEDHSSLVKYYENLANTHLNRHAEE